MLTIYTKKITRSRSWMRGERKRYGKNKEDNCYWKPWERNKVVKFCLVFITYEKQIQAFVPFMIPHYAFLKCQLLMDGPTTQNPFSLTGFSNDNTFRGYKVKTSFYCSNTVIKRNLFMGESPGILFSILHHQQLSAEQLPTMLLCPIDRC